VVITVEEVPQAIGGFYVVTCSEQSINADLGAQNGNPVGASYAWNVNLPLPTNVSLFGGAVGNGTNQVVNDRLENTGGAPVIVPYSYNITQGSCVGATSGFFVPLLPTGVGPCRLPENPVYMDLELTAVPVNGITSLTWKSHLTGLRPTSYTLERRLDVQEFVALNSETHDEGKALYSFKDDQFNKKTIYRIRMNFPNGAVFYSQYVEVERGWANIPDFSIYPNPATDQVTIEANAEMEGVWSYQLLDVHGKRIAAGKIQSRKAQITIGSLAQGVYVLHVKDEKGNVCLKRIVKE